MTRGPDWIKAGGLLLERTRGGRYRWRHGRWKVFLTPPEFDGAPWTAHGSGGDVATRASGGTADAAMWTFRLILGWAESMVEPPSFLDRCEDAADLLMCALWASEWEEHIYGEPVPEQVDGEPVE